MNADKQKLTIQLQEFQRRLDAEPDLKEFQKTPDGNASSLPISFVEMKLDEIYYGQWELTDVQTQQIFNEVVGTGILTVWHPVTDRPIRRAGFASVVITQDKDAKLVDFNATKKKNALDLAFPKLKAEILKNAANSLGKVFGRDVNRKNQASFRPRLNPISDDAFKVAIERIGKGEHDLIAKIESAFILSEDQRMMLEGETSHKLLENGRTR